MNDSHLEIRTDIRPAHKSSQSSPTLWVIVSVVLALGLLWVLRGLLERGSETAGHSGVAAPVSAPADLPDESTAIEANRSGDWVYKCLGVDGVVAFQSRPCAQGDQTLDRVLAISDTPLEVARARAKEREAVRRAGQMAAL